MLVALLGLLGLLGACTPTSGTHPSPTRPAPHTAFSAEDVRRWAHARVDPAHEVRIEARFEPATRTLVGTVRETARNVTAAPLSVLELHRYLEAFRDARSVLAKESGGQLRGTPLVYDGRTRLDGLRVDGVDHLARTERSVVAGDFTQLRVHLRAPIPAGATFTVETRFAAHLPTLSARAGSVPGFHLLAQFFPKLAVLTPGGFVTFPYHGQGEFFADFARYDVTLDVPSGYAVDGTGDVTRTAAAPRRTRHHFVAEHVHDVAYAVVRDGETTQRRCAGVEVRVLAPPSYGLARTAHADATCFGLERLGEVLVPYPYPSLVVIVPPRGADGGAGMEYPRAFVTDGPWFAHGALAPLGVFETTFHELAHQWFEGMVANDEVAHPVLDEGLASYYGARLSAEYAGATRTHVLDVLRPAATRRALPTSTGSASSYDDFEYGLVIYGRSALVLETFARTFGVAALDRSVRDYVARAAFTHPTLDTFLASFPVRTDDGPTRDLVMSTFFVGRRVTTRLHRDRAARLGPSDLPVTLLEDGRRVALRDAERAITGRCTALDPDAANLLDPVRRDQRRCPRLPAMDSPLASLLGPIVRAVLP